MTALSQTMSEMHRNYYPRAKWIAEACSYFHSCGEQCSVSWGHVASNKSHSSPSQWHASHVPGTANSFAF